MSELLNSGRIAMINRREQRKQILSNWEASGLLDGLKEASKMNIAMLMESEASAMLNKDYDAIGFYSKMYNRCISIEDDFSAQFHLYKLIFTIQDNIIKKHC